MTMTLQELAAMDTARETLRYVRDKTKPCRGCVRGTKEGGWHSTCKKFRAIQNRLGKALRQLNAALEEEDRLDAEDGRYGQGCT